MSIPIARQIPDSVFLILARIVTFACGAGILAITSRYFDKGVFGIWALVTSLTSVVASFDLGMANAVRNRLAIEGPTEGQGDFAAAFWFLCLVGGLYFLLILGLFMESGFQEFFTTPNTGLRVSGGVALCISSALLLPRLPFYLGMNSFFSFREAKLNAIFDAGTWIAMFAVTLFAALFSLPLLLTVVLYQIANVGGCGLGLVIFLQRRRWTLRLTGFNARILGMWPKAYPFALLQFVGLAMNYMSTFIVGAAVNVAEAGPFRAALTIFQAMLSLQLATMMPLWSEFSFAISRGEGRAASRLLRIGALKSSLFVIPILVFSIIAPWIIRQWLALPIETFPLPILLGGWAMLAGATNLLSVMLNGVGRALLSFFAILPGALIVVPLSLYMGRHFGVDGVAVSFLAMSALNVTLLLLACSMWIRHQRRREELRG